MNQTSDNRTLELWHRELAAGFMTWFAFGLSNFLWAHVTHNVSYMTYVDLWHSWRGGYIPGGFALVTYGMFRVIRARLSVTYVMGGLGVYLLPFVLVMVILGLYAMIPLEIRSHVPNWHYISIATHGPVALALQGAGLASAIYWKRGLRRTITDTLIPPLLVLALVSVIGLVIVAGSPHWRWRTAFAWSTREIELRNGALNVEGVLDVRYQDAYQVHAIYEVRATRRSLRAVGLSVEWLDTDPAAHNTHDARLRRLRFSMPAAAEEKNIPGTFDTPQAGQLSRVRVRVVSPTHGLLREFAVPISGIHPN